MSITGRCVYSMSILSLHKCFTDHRLSEYMIQVNLNIRIIVFMSIWMIRDIVHCRGFLEKFHD